MMLSILLEEYIYIYISTLNDNYKKQKESGVVMLFIRIPKITFLDNTLIPRTSTLELK